MTIVTFPGRIAMRVLDCAVAVALGGILLTSDGSSIVFARAAVDVAFDEWTVPTAKSRPHDPAVAPDGSAWWSGQGANVLGQLDGVPERIVKRHVPFGQIEVLDAHTPLVTTVLELL